MKHKGIPYNIGGATHYCPTSYEQISVRTYLQIMEEWDDKEDLIKLFCIITGFDYDRLNNAKFQEGYEQEIFRGIAWIYQEKIEWDKLVPKEFLIIDDKEIKIPEDIGDESIGQKISIMQAASEEDVSELQLIPDVLSIYLDPHFNEYDKPLEERKFNKKRAIEFREKILDLPILECYPLAFFFLNRSKSSTKLGESILLRMSQFRTFIADSLAMTSLKSIDLKRSVI